MNKITDITDTKPNEALIEHLERLLEFAKSGELRTMLSISGWNDDAWSHGWVLDDRNSKRRMLGELSMLSYDIHTNQAFLDGNTVLNNAFDMD